MFVYFYTCKMINKIRGALKEAQIHIDFVKKVRWCSFTHHKVDEIFSINDN